MSDDAMTLTVGYVILGSAAALFTWVVCSGIYDWLQHKKEKDDGRD